MKLLIKLSMITGVFLSAATIVFSETKKTVNVLTWWGYLDDFNASKLIQKKCGATLTHDNYTSNDDMLRRWSVQSNKYDLLIFSDTIYNAVKNQIILKNSNLSKKSNDYNPIIQKKYSHSHFPSNVTYFAHALTGFIWNPKVIKLTEADTVQSAFQKAKNNKVILLDDPVEINMLLTAGINNNFKGSSNIISSSNFKKLTQNADVYISNEINQIYSKKEFAFSYQWSGHAFSKQLSFKKYNFLINANLSYISTDLIAQIKDDPIAACAANVLASKEFLSGFQKRSGYFSPYGDIDSVPEGEFKDVYKKFLKNLPKLHWLEPPSGIQFKKLNHEWDVVKYELSQDRK